MSSQKAWCSLGVQSNICNVKKAPRRYFLWTFIAQQHHQGELQLKHSPHRISCSQILSHSKHIIKLQTVRLLYKRSLQTISGFRPPDLMVPLHLPLQNIWGCRCQSECVASHTATGNAALFSQPKRKIGPKANINHSGDQQGHRREHSQGRSSAHLL